MALLIQLTKEFVQTLGDGKEKGSLECCSPQGHRELDTTQRLNNKSESTLRGLEVTPSPELFWKDHLCVPNTIFPWKILHRPLSFLQQMADLRTLPALPPVE